MKLIGAINPLRPNPCFSVPVFKDGEALFTQTLKNEKIILGFHKIECTDGIYVPIDNGAEYSVGDNAAYAFYLTEKSIIYGNYKSVSSYLTESIDLFYERPFLLKEIGDFLCDENVQLQANQLIIDLNASTPRINTVSKSKIAHENKHSRQVKDNKKLIAPHGGKGLVCALLQNDELQLEIEKSVFMKKIQIPELTKDDLIMMGIGGFSPLDGFMSYADWRGVCENFQLTDGTFWPVPITLDVSKADADLIAEGDEIALEYDGEIYATMTVFEKYKMTKSDKKWECEKIFMGKGKMSIDGRFWQRAMDRDHPGVLMVMAHKEYNLAGPVKVLSDGGYPAKYEGFYLTPEQTRCVLNERGWQNVAALQMGFPMLRSHEFVAKIAIEVCDGVLIHSLISSSIHNPCDIPADVRIPAIDTLIEHYFVKENIIHTGYPLYNIRNLGPRAGLLHATSHQNYGVNQMLIGSAHANFFEFYGLFEAQEIFERIPETGDSSKDLLCKPMKADPAFYCLECDGMASYRTCPHDSKFHLTLSGIKLHSGLRYGTIPPYFIRAEVQDILFKYYEQFSRELDDKISGVSNNAA